jgi:hypothetical protein
MVLARLAVDWIIERSPRKTFLLSNALSLAASTAITGLRESQPGPPGTASPVEE